MSWKNLHLSSPIFRHDCSANKIHALYHRHLQIWCQIPWPQIMNRWLWRTRRPDELLHQLCAWSSLLKYTIPYLCFWCVIWGPEKRPQYLQTYLGKTLQLFSSSKNLHPFTQDRFLKRLWDRSSLCQIQDHSRRPDID